MADSAHLFAYQRPSVLDEAAGRLGLETSGGRALAKPASHPRFFTGFLAHPGATASGLLATTLADRDNPRLRDARALVAAGAVALAGDVATVTVADHVQRVRLGAGGQAWCTCDWWAKHRGTRGPCKHVLAVRLARDAAASPAARQVTNAERG
jgi:SWIM zinc finger